jgi:hypothetical protein
MPDAVITGVDAYDDQFGMRGRSVYLAGSEDAPAFAAMEIYGRTYNGALLVRKPTRDDLGAQFVVFNGSFPLTAGTFGRAVNQYQMIAKYGSGIASGNRDAVGTKAGQWGLYRGHEGFLVIGPVLSDTSLYVVVRNNVCRSQTTPGGYYFNYPNACTFCCGWCVDSDNPAFWNNCGAAPATLQCTVQADCVGGPETITLTKFSDCKSALGLSWRGNTPVEEIDMSCVDCISGLPISSSGFASRLGIQIECPHPGGLTQPAWYWTVRGYYLGTTGIVYFNSETTAPAKYFQQNKAFSQVDCSGYMICNPFSFHIEGTVYCHAANTYYATTGCVSCVGTGYTMDITL